MTLFDDNKIKPSELIKKLRKLKGITQQQLADEIGYSVTHIIRIENGKKDLSKEAISLLTNAFNVDLYQYIQLANKFGSVEVYKIILIYVS